MLPDLRDYQDDGISRARAAYAAGHRHVLLVAPTGAGKTTAFCYIILSAMARRRRSVVVAHRRELIDQASERLDDYGIEHGVIMAKHKRWRPEAPVQVTSLDTWRWRGAGEVPFDFIVIDEAHRALGAGYVKLVATYPKAWVLGTTATPYRGDGRGLGAAFDIMVRMASIRDLIDRGYLVRPRIFAPSAPDLVGVHTRHGEYVEEELAARCDRADLIGDMVVHWRKLAAGRPSIGFAVNVQHSQNCAAAFAAAGIEAVHIDASTPLDVRKVVLGRLRAGEPIVVWNVGILTEGTDLPPVSCIIQARPAKSRCFYVQTGGRGLRAYPGKTDCIMLDHAGAWEMHGGLLQDDDVTLEDGLARPKAANDDEKDISLRQCRSCYAIYEGRFKCCPECGYRAPSALPSAKDGTLVEIDPEAQAAARKREISDAHDLAALLKIERARGYKPGWAQHIWAGKRKARSRYRYGA